MNDFNKRALELNDLAYGIDLVLNLGIVTNAYMYDMIYTWSKILSFTSSSLKHCTVGIKQVKFLFVLCFLKVLFQEGQMNSRKKWSGYLCLN